MIKPTVLCVLDGWGIAPPGPGNAISLAKVPQYTKFWQSYPHTMLSASGEAVGLPPNEDGNTETGHINMGAGRVVYQDLPRITMAITDGSFFRNDAFEDAIIYAKEHKSNLHIMGLLSDSGVHASRDHLYALITMVREHGCPCPVYLHLFTDGRDSPPNSAKRFLAEVEVKLGALRTGKIATVMGRYYGMDRDRRWERTQKAYETLTQIDGPTAKSAIDLVTESYAKGITDEFIEPTMLLDENGQPYPRIKNHDSVIFYNYRIDRPRQLTRAFVLPDFETRPTVDEFDPYAVKYYHKHLVELDSRNTPFMRKVTLPNIFFATMTEYEKNLPCVAAFPPHIVENPIGAVYANSGLKQLHAAETEKERFVTYYFNGLRERPFEGEDRIIVPSPKVATYDLSPGMSITELTDRVLQQITTGVYAFVLVNFANPDMVAHTGNIPAAVRAVEAADTALGKIVDAVLAIGGTCVLTGDHGNVEEMLGPNGEMDTEHSTYPVPFIMIHEQLEKFPHSLPQGKLADIAPTILSFAGIPVPSDMTGKNLLADLPILKG